MGSRGVGKAEGEPSSSKGAQGVGSMSPGSRRAEGSRLWALLVVIAFVLIGIPVWRHLTRIHRPDLAHARMQRAAELTASFHLPIQITLHVDADIPSDQVAEGLWRALDVARSQQDQQGAPTWTARVESLGPGGCSASAWPAPAAGMSRQTQTDRACPEAAEALRSGLGLLRNASNASESVAAWELLLQQLTLDAQGRYHIAVLPSEGPARLVLGRQRGAVLWYDAGQRASGPESGNEHLSKALDLASPALAHAFLSNAGPHRDPQQAGPAAARQLPLSAAGDAVLSFSLCNADPDGSFATWGDFGATFERRYLEPFRDALEPAAARLAFESQVLLFTPSKERGAWSEALAAYTVKHSRLPYLVDSHWDLNTGGRAADRQDPAASREPKRGPAASEPLIPSHVLHFVAYVPPSDQRPLRLLLPDGSPSPTNGFWIPSWGGVHVLDGVGVAAGPLHAADPRNGDGPSSSEGLSREAEQQQQQRQRQRRQRRRWPPTAGSCAAAGAAVPLSAEQRRRLARGVLSQLRTLLGVDLRERLPGRSGRGASELEVDALSDARGSVSGWEVDALTRHRAAENVAAAARVLGSLSRLVGELPSLGMPDVIGDQVEASLSALDEAVAAMRRGDYSRAAAWAQSARTQAEAAFSNPAVLAQLSHAQMHLVGVYLPFFLPASLVLLQAIVLEAKTWIKKKPAPRSSSWASLYY